jgi:hypothetical protein
MRVTLGLMRIPLTIETQRDATLLWDLLDGDSAAPGDQVEVAPGIRLIYTTAEETKGLDLPWTYHFVIELAGGITSGAAIAGWIYSRLSQKRGKIRRIEVNERECELDQGQITRIIDRKITIEQDE